MHTSKVKVTRGRHVFGGHKGKLSIDGDTLSIEFDKDREPITFDGSLLKRASFNPSNGLWAFRLVDNRKLFVQSAGGLLGADRTDAGREANELIKGILKRYNIRSSIFL